MNWIDGKPLMGTIEPYRRHILETVLYTFDGERPQYNFALCGRGKKNYKTSDLILAVLYRFLAWESPMGNDCFVLANDEDQANDDLDLAKKLIKASPLAAQAVKVLDKEIVRRDGKGSLRILPANDADGAHGKTYSVCAFDEIHGYRDHALFEALAMDPTRHDALWWITSYDGLKQTPGIPLHDFKTVGRAATDPRMFFSWYSGQFTTDPALKDAAPEVRANPSMSSWGPGDTGREYLRQQKARLPQSMYRRLHLNLPGAPVGAAFDADMIEQAAKGCPPLNPPEPGRTYSAFVDMSGGSKDDAVLAIAHRDRLAGRTVLDYIECQDGPPPFDPYAAALKFARTLKRYGIARVTGDAYGGQTFRMALAAEGIAYTLTNRSAGAIYDAFEPLLNAGEVDLLSVPKLIEQLTELVWRGGRINHPTMGHDDFANAVAGAIVEAAGAESSGPTFVFG